MPNVENDGVTIHYTVDGPDDVPPVVLLEGLGYGRWMWRWLTADLTPDFQVLRPDNRGTGKSDVPEGPYTIDTMATDVEAVLADFGADSAHVVGASMGGMIAMSYALSFDRTATLTLLCTSPGGEEAVETPPEVIDHIFSAPADADERATIRHRMEPAVSADFYERDPELVSSIVDDRLRGDADHSGRKAQAAAVEAFDVSDRLEEIDYASFVLHGDADRVVPVQNGRLLDRELPRATYEEFSGGPHLFFIEQRDEVNDQIRRFLEMHT